MEIMFGYNCSNLMFHLSSALSNSDLIHPGDNIVVSPACHDANVASWLWLARNAGAQTRYLPLMDDKTSEEADKVDVEQLTSVIDEKTRTEIQKKMFGNGNFLASLRIHFAEQREGSIMWPLSWYTVLKYTFNP